MKRTTILLLLLILSFEGQGFARESEPIEGKGQPQFQLLMSKDDKVCTYMRDVLNRDLKEYGLRNHKDKFKDSVFTAIKWTSLEKGYGYAGKVASFDINNDGQMDLVIRQSTSGGKSVTFDRLFIFDQGQALESLKTARDLYEKAIGMVNIDFREGYNFRGLPPRTHDSGLMKGQQYYEGMSWNNYI